MADKPLMDPDEFARGAQQAFGKSPRQPKPVTMQPAPKDAFADMVRLTDQAWPPPRGPSQYDSLQQNDPLVVKFITELFGPMISEAEATKPRTYRRGTSGMPMPWCFMQSRGVPYGEQWVACWAPADHAWRLIYDAGKLDYECYRRPNDDGLRKLCFLIGWFKVRTDCHFMQYNEDRHIWRRGNEVAVNRRGAGERRDEQRADLLGEPALWYLAGGQSDSQPSDGRAVADRVRFHRFGLPDILLRIERAKLIQALSKAQAFWAAWKPGVNAVSGCGRFLALGDFDFRYYIGVGTQAGIHHAESREDALGVVIRFHRDGIEGAAPQTKRKHEARKDYELQITASDFARLCAKLLPNQELLKETA